MSLRANQADQALIQIEISQDYVAPQEMTSDDNKVFASADYPWSGAAGKEPVIMPDGMITGGVITPHGDAGKVSVSAGTAYVGGVLRTIAQTDVTLTLTAGGHITHSIVAYDDSGWKYKAIPGDTHTSHTDDRNGDGGPPYIGVGEIEVGQVRTVGDTGYVLSASAISQIVGVSTERYDYPLWTEDYAAGSIEFISTLPAIHTAGAAKAVWVQVYTPVFMDLEPASDFVPPETTHSQSSTAVYGGAIGAASSALGQGSFTVFLRDGVTDPIVALKNQKIWVKFHPHRLRAPHILCQGILGISRSYPAGDSIQADCTLTADGPAVEVAE